MAGSSFGTIFRLTTWGESHGKGVGVVVDGVPAGLSLSERIFRFTSTAGSRDRTALTTNGKIRYRSDFIRHFRRKNDRYPDFHGGME